MGSECEPKVRKVQEGSEKPNTQTEGLQKTPGSSTTKGQDYEVVLCCLFFLRALRLTSDFFLASNHAVAGKFDDAVLFYKLKEDQCQEYRAILLQAKHREKIKNNNLTLSNPFLLNKHLKSFKDIRNLWEQPINVENQLIKFREVSLVLYTNTGCKSGDKALDVTTSPYLAHLRDLLNTGGRLLRISNALRTKLPQEQETDEFIGHLIIYTEQMSVEAVDQFLEEEISNVLKLTSPRVATKLKTEFKNMVKDWWREKGEIRYLTAKSEEWTKVLEMQLSRLNTDTLFIDRRLNLDFTEAALERFKSATGQTQSSIYVRDNYQATVTRLRLLKALRNCLVLEAKYLKNVLDEVEALWGTTVCLTLAVDISTDSLIELSQLLQHLQKAVSSQADRQLVVISKERPTNIEFVFTAEETWSVLNSATHERLLSVSVDLQGKIITLRDVVGLHTSYIMSDKFIHSICDLVNGTIKLGESIPATQEYYVPRCIQRLFSKKTNLNTIKNKRTLIFPKNLLTLDHGKLKILSPSELKVTNNITETIIVKGVRFDSEIRNLCCELCVPGISGDFGQESLGSKVMEFTPFTWMCKEKVVVIEGIPGVGKSSFVTAMCSSVKERFPESWVIRVDTGKHSRFISERDFRNTSEITAFLQKGLPGTFDYFERELLEHSLYVTGNVFLFLDAYDEISTDFTTQCCHLLKRISTTVKYQQMVVTSRPVTSKKVEKALGVKAFNIPVFCENEQRLFMERYCKTRGKDVDEEEISSLLHSAGPVLEIPLLCKMAAEVLLHRDTNILLKYDNPWRKVLLYKLFVEQNINNRLAEKLGLDVSIPGVRTLLGNNAKKHVKRLQSLAVRNLMPVNQLSTFNASKKMPEEIFGLVVNNGETVEFEHQTFSEYFLGCWLAQHWKQCHIQFLRKIFCHNNNEFVLATLAWSLLEGFHMHEAVAQGDEDTVRRLLSSGVRDRDRGGRSALHVAAMTHAKHKKIWELMMATEKDRYEKDDVFDLTPVMYAELFSNWDFIEVMLQNGIKLESLNCFTDQNVTKDVIVQIIKHDLISMFKFILLQHNEIFHKTFDDKGSTLLHIAAANNCTGVLKVLIQEHYEVNITNYDEETPLHESSRYGHIEAIRLLLENGADPNIKRKNGHTALMLAAFEDHLDVVKLLLDNGANPNIKTEDGYTALILAADQCNMDVVQMLIAGGTIINIKAEDGYTALIAAAGQGHLDVVKLLLENGADLNIKDEDGYTALMMAANQCHLEIVEILLKAGADPNIKDKDGYTALMEAASQSHLEEVKVLIANGADLNLTKNNGYTALMLVAHQGQLGAVKLLMENGADQNMKDENGYTALLLAARQGHLEIVKILIENVTDQKIKVEDWNKSIILAASRGHLEIAKVLIEKGLNAKIKGKYYCNAFFLAAGEGHMDVVKLLIDTGTDPNIKSENGYTALMVAADQCHVKMVNMLIENGADPKIKAEDGYTALMAAACQGHLDVVKLLLANGSDLNEQEEDGCTALMLATVLCHLKIVELLIQKGADPNIKDKYGYTPLMDAACQGHLNLLKLLIANQADPNITKNNGYTALMLAACHGHLEVVKMLLKYGTETNIKAEDGNTALMIAAHHGHAEIVNMLIEYRTDTNVRNGKGDTALTLAVKKGHTGVVCLLLEKGMDIHLSSEDGSTPRMFTESRYHLDVLKLLIEKGLITNIQNEDSYTALTIASGLGLLEIVNLLVDSGIDLNRKNISCYTPLMLAADQCHLEVVKILLSNGSDPNLKAEDGHTALIAAAGQGHLEIVKLLIDNRADPNIQDDDGYTALILSAGQGHLEVVKLLVENGADPNIKDNDGYTALMEATGQRHLEVMKLLLENGTDPNIVNNNDNTALMLAASQGHLNVVELLIDNRADPNIRNKYGCTAMLVAAGEGHMDVVKLLREYINILTWD